MTLPIRKMKAGSRIIQSGTVYFSSPKIETLLNLLDFLLELLLRKLLSSHSYSRDLVVVVEVFLVLEVLRGNMCCKSEIYHSK